jgi:FdhD protein
VPIPAAHRVSVLVSRDGARTTTEDWVAAEEPLQILTEAEGRPTTPLAVTMRTPGHEQELAVGFLFTEGLIAGAEALAKPTFRELLPGVGRHNEITVRLARDFDASELQRNFYATSSCGVCGKATIAQIERVAPRIAAGLVVAADVLASLPAKLRAAQPNFDLTGGLHAVGLFTSDGELLVAREDVGRHNAMDKAIGRLVLDGAVPARAAIALVSGRASFELVQKAAMAAIPVLCAVSAPSSLAVRAAERFGMTLVAFLRDGRHSVYANAERVGL